MNSSIKNLLISSVACTFLFSCAKDVTSPIAPDNDNLVELTLIASAPQTKTEMDGTTPLWSKGDAIGVSTGESNSNYKFTTNIESASAVASFTGTTNVSARQYAYYPYTQNGVNDLGAKVDMPKVQYPTATSFDGAADVMVAKAFDVDPESKTVENLQFTRLGAIVKVILIDTDNVMNNNQHLKSVSMTAESDLAGRVYINMKEQKLGDLYYDKSKTVTANYTSTTEYAINGSDATYLIVYPQTLAGGSTLSFTANTEEYTITKTVKVPNSGIELSAGLITTLKINLSASNIVESAKGADLPFIDNFSWQAATDEAGITSNSSYSMLSSVFAGKEASAVRIGTGSKTGYLVTNELNLSSAFYVIVSAKAYNASDGSKIKVIIDEETSQVSQSSLTTDYGDYIFNFNAATKNSKVKITTDKKRAILNNIQIKSGTYVFPPVINIVSSNIISVANTAGSHTISYSIENPTEASLTAASSDSWITDIDCSTSGTVSFKVAAQAKGADERTGSITLKYAGAKDAVITIKQAAGEGVSKPSSVVLSNWNNLFKTSYNGTVNGIKENSFTLSGDKDGVTISVQNGNSKNGYVKDEDLRAYLGYTITITAPTGKNIVGISTTKGGKSFTSGITTEIGTGEINNNSFSWTGNSSSVKLSIGATVSFKTITVTYQ